MLAMMPNEVQVTVRLPADIARRATELAERLKDYRDFQAFRMTRAAVFRLAMIQGLEHLEAKYPSDVSEDTDERNS